MASLTKNQLDLLRAIARSKNVSEPTSKEFIKQNRFGASSSIYRALQSLLENEIVYKSENGYILYDRFFGQCLR